MKDLVEKEQIDCDFVITRAMDVQLENLNRDKLKAAYDRLIKNGVPCANDVFQSPEETAEAVNLQTNGIH